MEASKQVALYMARAEVNPALRKWGGLALNEHGQSMKARVGARLGEEVVATLDLQIAHSIAEHGMEYTANLIDRAINLSGGNELKFRELLTIALDYRQTVTRVQRRLTSPFAW